MKLTIKIDLGNAAFDVDDQTARFRSGAEVARILRFAASSFADCTIERGESLTLFDVNGEQGRSIAGNVAKPRASRVMLASVHRVIGPGAERARPACQARNGSQRNQPQGEPTMQKWQNISAGKIQCNRFNKAWSALNWENSTFVELTGVIGVKESRSVLSTLGSSRSREDVRAAQEKIGDQFAWTVTAGNVNAVIKAIDAEMVALIQNRPVDDNRRTPEAEAERNAEFSRATEAAKTKGDVSRRAFVAHYGSGQTVKVEPGQMAVIAKVCFDNSDSMSDYFDRHATLSQDFALLVVPKQAETERLARRGAAVSSLLAGLGDALEWHTEKWSMGHGNYLEGGGFELPTDLQGLRDGYRPGGVTHAHWEISFRQAYRDSFELDAIAGYGEKPTEPEPRAKVDGIEITENEEKDGLEIRFPGKPAAAVLDSLKANGWRWSRFSSCWYTRRTAAAREFAESLTGDSSNAEGGGEPAPAAPSAKSAGKAVSDEVLDVLRQADFDSDSIQINGQLDRDLYLKVNKALESVGGKWNRGRKCHVFAQNPRALFDLDEGRTAPEAMTGEAIARAVENGTGAAAVWQLFPTPPELAARMVELAQLPQEAIVLEPSVGTGNIAKAAFDWRPIHITCVEIDSRVIDAFKASFRSWENSRISIVQGDFLAQNGNLGKFDAVLMNPPFANGADIRHIQHAITFLKPGGRLVAICANGPRQQEQLKPIVDEHGGTWEPLPAGTFKEQGTGVNTVLLSLTV